MPVRFTELIIDCANPTLVAKFWSAVLGWPITDEDPDGLEVSGGPGTSPKLLFLKVPEAKTVKNRLHIDVNPSAGSNQAAEVARILALGATHADVDQGDQTWVVLADPEGNEFCVLRSAVD